ncbi:hypothetical protein [Halomonas kalidii]|uniref:Uncharacterized protein n=1 Tax=Halomonas kalidii TaxID=3043293 RepID=A0ABT6VQV1_9GAMM|nr:hypothetical protein [Halomonas kalidii]MDI5936367.1 hypothetical protein [Halomonas kalidii]
MADLGHSFADNKIFIEELEKAVPHFYQQVGQRLGAWVAPPPKLRRRVPVEGNSDADAGDVEARQGDTEGWEAAE